VEIASKDFVGFIELMAVPGPQDLVDVQVLEGLTGNE